MSNPLTSACLTLACLLAAAALASGASSGFPSEKPEDRAARHERIAQRRSGTVITVHRGASAFAPENTMEAYAAAMDYGADGCEVDVRRTADGVLVLFHDDMLDRLTDGFGAPSELTCDQLRSPEPRLNYGGARRELRPPTFEQLLVLARQRAMLLHLDMKEPGLEADVARMLDEADMWDYVVSLSPYNSGGLAKNARFKPLAYKAPGLFEQRTDMDPETVRAALAKPGDMIIVDDPRVAARELKRPPYKRVPLPEFPAACSSQSRPAQNTEGYQSFLSSLSANSQADLLKLITSSDDLRADPATDRQRERTERLLSRAWAAQRLGRAGRKSPEVIAVLEGLARDRTLHTEWLYHGLDGAMAVRALAMLGSVGSVPVLIDTFRRTDPELKKIANPQWASNPLSWTDWRIKSCILLALGELRCEAGKRFLLSYLAMDESKAREMSPVMYDDAARALLRHDLSLPELASLLTSPHSIARGAAIMECIDHPSVSRTAALVAVAPWALELPRAK